ncbi:hypothetical protein EDC04DRAFT_2616861 [Pisolithus marmoratus]|nr:hypothetical protein EDC04DRAFT_2616861 [Pisolithus marmoratus]
MTLSWMNLGNYLNNATLHLTIKTDRITDTNLAELAGTWAPALPQDLNDRQTYQEALAHHLVALGHVVITLLHASSQCWDVFEGYIREGNEKGYWEAQDMDSNVTRMCKVPVLQLIQDVKIWWDSIYLMIQQLWLLEQPINAFLDHPNNRDLKKYKLSQMEWNVLQDFKAILEVPHHAIQVLSHEKLPTICNYLKAFKRFYVTGKRWEKIQAMHALLPIYKKMGDMKAYLIAMILNPNKCLKWICKHWNPTNIEKMLRVIHDTAYGLVDDDDDDEDDSFTDKGFGRSVEEELSLYLNMKLSCVGIDSLKFWELMESMIR